ncbi:MAG: FkbM family methyltransferase [Bacteroidota bacterium]
MKNTVKQFLKAIGLYKSLYKVRFNSKYGQRETYTLDQGDLRVNYSTIDKYSKKWFFPRYDNGRTHEPTIIELLKNNLKQDTCFIDVGANLGFFTCLGGVLCSNGSVHAFEMDPKCIPLIEENVGLNKLDNVTVNNNAVSDREGVEKIPDLSTPDPRLMILKPSDDAEGIEVQGISLDDYFKKNEIKPDFVKVDAEGAELKVLKGMPDTLKRNDVKILVEIHCQKLPNFDANFKDVLTILHDNGFEMREIIEHRSTQLSLRSLTLDSTLEGNVMVFATKD